MSEPNDAPDDRPAGWQTTVRNVVDAFVASVGESSRQLGTAAEHFAGETMRLMESAASQVEESLARSSELSQAAERAAEEARGAAATAAQDALAAATERFNAEADRLLSQINTNVEQSAARGSELSELVERSLEQARQAIDTQVQEAVGGASARLAAEARSLIDEVGVKVRESEQTRAALDQTTSDFDARSRDILSELTSRADEAVQRMSEMANLAQQAADAARVAAEQMAGEGQTAAAGQSGLDELKQSIEASMARATEMAAAAEQAAEAARTAAEEARTNAVQTQSAPAAAWPSEGASSTVLDRLEADYSLLTGVVRDLSERIASLSLLATAPSREEPPPAPPSSESTDAPASAAAPFWQANAERSETPEAGSEPTESPRDAYESESAEAGLPTAEPPLAAYAPPYEELSASEPEPPAVSEAPVFGFELPDAEPAAPYASAEPASPTPWPAPAETTAPAAAEQSPFDVVGGEPTEVSPTSAWDTPTWPAEATAPASQSWQHESPTAELPATEPAEAVAEPSPWWETPAVEPIETPSWQAELPPTADVVEPPVEPEPESEPSPVVQLWPSYEEAEATTALESAMTPAPEAEAPTEVEQQPWYEEPQPIVEPAVELPTETPPSPEIPSEEPAVASLWPPVTDAEPAAAPIAEPAAEAEPALVGAGAEPGEQIEGRVTLNVSPITDFDRLLNLDGALGRLPMIRNVTLADYARDEVTFRIELEMPVSVKDFARSLSETSGHSILPVSVSEGHVRLEFTGMAA